MILEYTVNNQPHHIATGVDTSLLFRIAKRNNYIDGSALENAIRDLSANALTIYVFLANKPKQFIWSINSSFRTPSLDTSEAIYEAVNELILKGYLEVTPQTFTYVETGELIEDSIFEFHEVPDTSKRRSTEQTKRRW
ncbi:MAG: hypothetical protein IKB64_08575 [Paludibacteraceae bacterium]|nr:hypothetical protein [Paludibacteraceae bacterium]